MALLPPPDISTAYVDEVNRPSKDFYNWIKSLYDYTRNLTIGGGGGGTPGGAPGNVQYNAGAGTFGGYTNTQVTALLDQFTSTLKGVVPGSGGGTTNFLRADGTWTSPGGSGAPGGSVGQIQFNNAGSFGGYTNTQVTALLDLFTNTLRGLVPSSGGGTVNFLRADGTWAVPPGGGGGGSGIRAQRSITGGPVTLVGTDEILNINVASALGITLPAAATRSGKSLTFKDVGPHAFANHITLTPSGGDLIDGRATFVMTNDHQAITLNPFNDGVNSGWFIT